MSGENVRSIYTLRHDEIVELARTRAENNEGIEHGFQPGSAQAKWWVQNPEREQPHNPWCENLHPKHYREWQASFERSLLLHSTGEVSA